MIWSLLLIGQQATEQAGAAAEHAEAGGHHVPAIAEWVNHLLGPTVYEIQKAIMPTFYGWFGAEWHGDPAMPVPVHIVMFFIAVLVSTLVLWLVRGKLSVENPSHRQQVFELLIGGIRSLIRDNIGPHGMKYFPVIATFAVLIGVCNLMGLVPGLIAPTANFNVPIGLAVMSFLYYNYVGVKENGLFGYLKHFAGPSAAMAVLFFPVEIISNLARIASLSMRLLWNIFGDETLAGAFQEIFAWGLPLILMPLGLFVALMQAFIFTMLSIIYISEVTQHEEAHESISPESQLEAVQA
jgi:F-type H+-transporting ATPase subunit a